MTYRASIFTALCLFISSAAQGQLFNIELSPVSGTTIVQNEVDPNNATRARIVIRASSPFGSTLINLRATNPLNDIDYITIEIATSQLVILKITGANDSSPFDSAGEIRFQPIVNPNVPQPPPPEPPIYYTGDLIVELLRCSGNVGSIRSHGIVQGIIGGSVTGSVEVIDRDTSDTAVRGDLGSFLVGNSSTGTGSILGNVLVEGGNIDTLIAYGSIGTSSTPVTVKGWSLGLLRNITAASIHANIQSENPSVGITQVRLVKATSGDFTGSLKAQSLSGGTGETGLRVAGNLSANVQITSDASNPIAVTGSMTGSSSSLSVGTNSSGGLTIGTLATDKRITIGGSLTGTTSIGAGGLRGQVIVNANNSGGTWQSPATATVGGVSLSPLPNYVLGSMTIGCGAIGRVPFALYNNDCMPPVRPTPGTIGRQAFFRATSPQSALVRFYGPVRIASGTDPATGVKVERQNGANWDDLTSSFTLTFEAPETGGALRQIKVADNTGASDPPNGVFRVVPRLSGGVRLLLCDVTGQPPVADFDYRFQIADGCYNPTVDVNRDGFMDPDDLSDYIACYFASPPCGFADYNCDYTVDPDDLSDYIAAYFLPCP